MARNESSGSRTNAWLRAHLVAGFVLLVFGISYLVGVPLLIAGTGAGTRVSRR